MTGDVKHLYVHVPFCNGKCSYCGFYSERYDAAVVDRYLRAVVIELEQCRSLGASAPETIYFGGGTPSVLSEDQLEQLCRAVCQSVSRVNLREWTVEANPGTLTEAKLGILTAAGVNRISLGVQSFDDRVLAELGRRHSAADTDSTVELVRAAGIRHVALDLIACLPGVDDEMWRRTLERVLALAADHLSVYALTIEPGTRLASLVHRGTVTISDDERVLGVLAETEALLERQGYERYEISNYARPGNECLHNLSFWRGGDYLGVGPAASSRLGCRRRTHAADLSGYLDFPSRGVAPPCEEEWLTEENDAVERFIFAFRLKEGVDIGRFCEAHPAAEGRVAEWEKKLCKLALDGVADCVNGRWRLTPQGRNLVDYVASELMP